MVSSVHNALSFDGLVSSHPIYVPVSGTAEIFSIFDSISYEKVRSKRCINVTISDIKDTSLSWDTKV